MTASTIKPLTAAEYMAAKAAGVDLHPATAHPDPDHVQWAHDGSQKREERYGDGLGPILEEAGERLTDPDGVARPAPGKRKRPQRYRAGCTDLSTDAALGHSAIDALWSGPGSPERAARLGLVRGVLEAVKPRDELEGLLAVQLIAAHGATMECYRLAMIPGQIFAGRSENLNQASKASRTFAVLLEALDKHRGKGSQQRVRVEHVHVYEGGQAVVGVVEGGGGGKKQKSRQPHALGHSSQRTLQGPDPEREAMPRSGDGERPMQDARRHQPRRADG